MPDDANKISHHSLAESADRFVHGRPILAYHKVEHRPRGVRWRSLYLSPRRFAQQMAEFADAGFTTVSLGAPRAPAGNAERSFVITFDDGYVSVLENAAPVLARHGFRAIQFLVSSQIGGTNRWDVAEGEVAAPLMNHAQVKAWLAAGHEIGSHTLSHPRLTQLTAAQQAEELRVSKQQLEDAFGVPIRHLAYPYGDFDDRVAWLAAEAGYETACTMVGGVNLAATPAWALHRIEGRYPRRTLRAIWQRMRRVWR